MVGVIVLSLLGGGLFAQCARQVFALGGVWAGLIVWAAGSGLCFWALWTHRQANIARVKSAGEARAAREQKIEDAANKLLEALGDLTVQTAAGAADCKAGLSALGEKADLLLASQPEKARLDAALADVSRIKSSCGLCSQTLAALQSALEDLAVQAAAGAADRRAGLSALGGKADLLLANQPEKARLEAALADVSLIKDACELCGQTVASLQSVLENTSGDITGGFVDCNAGLSELGEKTDALLANQPEKDQLNTALEAVSSVEGLCKALEKGISKNTTALQEAAGQWKDYNQKHRQTLEAAEEQIKYILELLANNYNLLRQVGEQYT